MNGKINSLEVTPEFSAKRAAIDDNLPAEERARLWGEIINEYLQTDDCRRLNPEASADFDEFLKTEDGLRWKAGLVEDTEIDGMDEGSEKMLIDAIENHSEPYISELRDIFKKYPKQCEEQDRLIQDAINRSYRKL